MKHALICGAGAVGLCCALSLRERGYEVTLIERDAAGGDGCSFGNAGMIVPSHFTPDGLPYIGRFARYSNLCVAAGHAMLGHQPGADHGAARCAGAGRRASADRARTAEPAALFMRTTRGSQR
jgi:glycine/D-amino acid oxidase-like deaminating enzyme